MREGHLRNLGTDRELNLQRDNELRKAIADTLGLRFFEGVAELASFCSDRFGLFDIADLSKRYPLSTSAELEGRRESVFEFLRTVCDLRRQYTRALTPFFERYTEESLVMIMLAERYNQKFYGDVFCETQSEHYQKWRFPSPSIKNVAIVAIVMGLGPQPEAGMTLLGGTVRDVLRRYRASIGKLWIPRKKYFDGRPRQTAYDCIRGGLLFPATRSGPERSRALAPALELIRPKVGTDGRVNLPSVEEINERYRGDAISASGNKVPSQTKKTGPSGKSAASVSKLAKPIGARRATKKIAAKSGIETSRSRPQKGTDGATGQVNNRARESE